MGNVLNWKHQPKEIRVIYIQDNTKNRIYPVLWSDSFAQFVVELYQLFPQTKQIESTTFMFRDACEKSVCVCSEATFQALVPKHKAVAPGVDCYYVSLESWIV